MADARAGLMKQPPGGALNGGRGDGDRALVLWLGTTSPELLKAACSRRELAVLQVSSDKINDVAPQARALVVEVPTDDPSFPVWGPQAVSDALAHGMHVALVQYENNDKMPLMEDRDATDRFYDAVKALPPLQDALSPCTATGIALLNGRAAISLAQAQIMRWSSAVLL